MRNDIDINDYKERLEEEKRRLLSDLGEIGVQADDLDQENWEGKQPNLNVSESDRNEVADEQEEYHERIAITETLEDRLRVTNDALDRIKDGSYGICRVCGEPIEAKRLEANPAAATCIQHMNS